MLNVLTSETYLAQCLADSEHPELAATTTVIIITTYTYLIRFLFYGHIGFLFFLPLQTVLQGIIMYSIILHMCEIMATLQVQYHTQRVYCKFVILVDICQITCDGDCIKLYSHQQFDII